VKLGLIAPFLLFQYLQIRGLPLDQLVKYLFLYGAVAKSKYLSHYVKAGICIVLMQS
jgi:hypothetical protein